MESQGARLWLVRHGQTDWNAAGRVQGQTPTHLNSQGHAQARALGEILRGRSFAACWSSDLPRAYETAESLLAAAELSLPIQRTDRLRERSFGQYEGFTASEVGAARKSLGLPQTGDLADWTGMPGIETNDELWTRISTTLRGISVPFANRDVLVVTHGGVIALTLYRILGLPDGSPRRFPLSNGIVAMVQWRADGWYLLNLVDMVMAAGKGEPQNDTSRSAG